MWTILPLEHALEQALKSAPNRGFGDADGAVILGAYHLARGRLESQILPYIVRQEPDLTVHDASHVANVMNNVVDLLGDELCKLSGVELYCLAVSILFHDVGNLYGRRGHRDKFDAIYWDVRDNNRDFSQEKVVVAKIIRAHTGPARDGTLDPLKDLTSNEQLYGRKVSVVTLAAILRFADELAEGPQRTSAYILKKNGFRSDATIYHQYARATQVCIDREGGRIVLTYNIHLKESDGAIESTSEKSIKALLGFIYTRALKLDEERRYNKHYCDLLQPYKFCRVQINFHLNEIELDLGLDPIILSDKIVPGQIETSIPKQYPLYEPESMWERLISLPLTDNSSDLSSK